MSYLTKCIYENSNRCALGMGEKKSVSTDERH